MNGNTTAECVVRCVTAEVTGRTDDTGKKESVGKAEESVKDERMQMIREIDLTICGEGCSLGVVSCTPSDLKELTAGWLLTEGRISREDDIPGMIYDEKTQTMHVVFHGHLQGNHKDEKTAMRFGAEWDQKDLKNLHKAFMQKPPLYEMTHTSHSCIVARHTETGSIEVLHRSEDVSRHSVVDKAVGWALLHDVDLHECLFFTSGRISARMVRKAAKAGVSALAAKGMATADAAEFAKEHGITLIGCIREDRAVRFT